jgi:hypothetical protein
MQASRQDQARPGKAGQGRARQDPTQQITRHISSHLIPAAVRLESAPDNKLGRSSFVAVPEGRSSTRTDESQHCVIVSKVFLPSSAPRLACNSIATILAECGPLQSRQSISPLSLTIIIILRTLLALLAFSAYPSGYFLVTPNCEQVRAPNLSQASQPDQSS